MGLIVQKYGGTSVGSPERIRAVAQRILATRERNHSLVVVVSAMGHTTDELIELAGQVSKNPPHREMDMLLTAGERISMALLSMALADLKISAVSLTGSQSGIITDQSHRRARIRRILGDRVRHGIEQGKVVIVAGFQGVSETKEITTLGRGGSDTSAVALAAALKADVCEIYTDVDGVFSADPRTVKKPKFWKRIPPDLMVELATRGAGVLHPRSVELAKQRGIVLCVKNSLNDSEGTQIMSGLDAHAMEEFDIAGVTSDASKFLISVELSRPTVLSAIWDRAAQSHLPVISPTFGDGKVQFFSDREGEAEWKKHLEGLVVQGFAQSYQLHLDLVPVSVVGNRFSQDGRALQEVIETLAESSILVTMGCASALAITVAVPDHKSQDAVQCLHQRFIEKNGK